jgi:uncharacterized protein YndB with AHSA1/START domain
VEIDRNAPVVARAELQIAADPEKVWEVLTGFEDWPSWNPDTSSVALEGGVAEGSVFRWKAGSARITSTLRRVERPRLVGWTGKTTGIRAAHVWELEPADGGTLVRTEESFDGVLARLLRRRLQRSLDRGLAEGLSHLKAEAERRTRPG